MHHNLCFVFHCVILEKENNVMIEWRKTSEEKVVSGSRRCIFDVSDRMWDSSHGGRI